MTFKSKATTVKNHVYANRAKYAAATTLFVCTAAFASRAQVWNRFLDTHGLTDEFYAEDTPAEEN